MWHFDFKIFPFLFALTFFTPGPDLGFDPKYKQFLSLFISHLPPTFPLPPADYFDVANLDSVYPCLDALHPEQNWHKIESWAGNSIEPSTTHLGFEWKKQATVWFLDQAYKSITHWSMRKHVGGTSHLWCELHVTSGTENEARHGWILEEKSKRGKW